MKSELERIADLDYKIEYLRGQIKKQADFIYNLRGVKYEEIKTTNYKGADKTLLRKIELEEKLQELEEERQRIIDRIDIIEDKTTVRILKKRYVEYKAFKEIAVEMKLSYKYVLKKHSIGIKKYKKEAKKGLQA